MSNEMVLDPDKLARIDAYLSQTSEDGTFSGSVLIAEKGQVLLSRGYGLADREQKITNSPQTRFRLGSITKQFTAMAIMILQSQGKLSVQDPICVYIPSCYAAWEDITIHHLLTHTSGLSSRLWVELKRADRITATSSHPVQTLALIKDLPLDSQPGEQFAYNNVGYILLAYIIEQVSSQSYEAFLQQAIFTPLGMLNTGYEHRSSGLAVGYANAYSTAPQLPFASMSISDGSGLLYSTVEDLFLWDQALYTDRLLPRTELERMFAPIIQESGVAGFAYGYAWYVGKDHGRAVVGHGGNIEGFSALIVRYPEDQITLLLLMNQADLNQLSVWAVISNEIFGEAHACEGSSAQSQGLVSAAELRIGGG
ncbi:MAG TPA: serine hydrolase domain-containing protein [Anaerolineales bacterium]|nr:serine hydrolase domain-containing protein [Anaerolineales bacterium]